MGETVHNNEAVSTLEGWFALHDFRSIDWAAWKALTGMERADALEEYLSQLDEWKKTTEQQQGGTALYSIVGHKADLLMIHLRPTLNELEEVETTFNKSLFAEVTTQSYSYVSVVELSSYMAKEGVDPATNPYVQSRLKPALPDMSHVCFYPMNKRRSGNDNWYMLSMEERRAMMRSHGEIGRTYAGRVVQIITGSVGFDDWEWGVTLFANDPVTFKKLVYEMRFDEVSARYGDFGTFFIGNQLHAEKLETWLSL